MVNSSKYWIWEFKDESDTDCYVAVQERPDGESVLGYFQGRAKVKNARSFQFAVGDRAAFVVCARVFVKKTEDSSNAAARSLFMISSHQKALK